jgi:hypothetical protein
MLEIGMCQYLWQEMIVESIGTQLQLARVATNKTPLTNSRTTAFP